MKPAVGLGMHLGEHDFLTVIGGENHVCKKVHGRYGSSSLSWTRGMQYCARTLRPYLTHLTVFAKRFGSLAQSYGFYILASCFHAQPVELLES